MTFVHIGGGLMASAGVSWADFGDAICHTGGGEGATESVDLIYLDPPFNSNATYAVCSCGQSGRAGDTAGESVVSQ